MFLVGVIIRRNSPGPVLFRQTRIGLGGAPFEIYKFRTMRRDTDGPLVTSARDARITDVGVFLRRWKIDELPQFLNVLRGEMSIVGPRPEVPRYVALWPPDIRKQVLSVRPGITDPAAILFRDESKLIEESVDSEHFYTEHIMPAKLQMYVEYVSSRSIKTDLRIICATVCAVFCKSPKTHSGGLELDDDTAIFGIQWSGGACGSAIRCGSRPAAMAGARYRDGCAESCTAGTGLPGIFLGSEVQELPLPPRRTLGFEPGQIRRFRGTGGRAARGYAGAPPVLVASRKAVAV